MEERLMMTPESQGPNDAPSGGRVVWLDDDAFDKLFPKTTIDHLLSEGERQKAEQERGEFEAVGRTLFLNEAGALPEADVYRIAYESMCRCIASRMVSPDEIREQSSMLHGPPLERGTSIIREAFEDALAGRPPRFSSAS
jgi:hypothetical protein